MIARLLARMLSEKNRMRFIFNMLIECAWAESGKAVTITMVANDLSAEEIRVEEIEPGVYLAQLGEPK
jgi:2-phospho-L-lactate guanylyltransferase (CobY/MobA/RfbA family)